MKRSILLCTAALSAVVSFSAAADDMGGMKMDKMGGMESMPKKAVTAHGVGTVKAIDAKAMSLTLAHGPVAEVHWPAMTMTFKVADAKLLAGITMGQKVAFTFESVGMDENTITALKPAQ